MVWENRETEIPERYTVCRGRDGLPENLLAEGRPWMRQGGQKAMQIFGEKSSQPRRRNTCKRPEAGTCWCLRTTRQASAAGEGEGKGEHEGK